MQANAASISMSGRSSEPSNPWTPTIEPKIETDVDKSDARNNTQPQQTKLMVRSQPIGAGRGRFRLFQPRQATRPAPCQRPQITNVHPAPCQSPHIAIVI